VFLAALVTQQAEVHPAFLSRLYSSGSNDALDISRLSRQVGTPDEAVRIFLHLAASEVATIPSSSTVSSRQSMRAYIADQFQIYKAILILQAVSP
jgi:hypothetical protein